MYLRCTFQTLCGSGCLLFQLKSEGGESNLDDTFSKLCHQAIVFQGTKMENKKKEL